MNVRGLGDYGKPDPKPKADGKETNSYTGGEKSGLAVENPDDLFSRAERLSGPLPSNARKVTLYKDGFVVDDNGEFRSLEKPENKKFMQEVQAGYAPKELQLGAQGPVSIALEDKRGQEYPHPPKKQELFVGEGNSLSVASSTAAAAVNVSAGEVTVDDSQPTTVLQIRFHNGERRRQTFNQSHTVSALHEFFMQCSAVEGSYKLLTGFPPKEISASPSATLKEAGLLNEVITQRLG